MEQETAHCSASDYFCESTPGTSKRKRKITQDTPDTFKSSMKGLDWSPFSPVPIFEPRGLLSSTHNESFTHNFENFTINSKGEDSVWLNSTIPTTPTKSSITGTSSLLANTSKLASSVKLGSPERNLILYPSLRSTRTKPSYSPSYKSPFFSTSTHNSPAKKRLFSTSTTPLKYADPVKYLNPDTMSAIYSFLTGGELYTCVHVSKAWRRSVRGDRQANRKMERFSVLRVLNKENCIKKGKNIAMELKMDEAGIKEQGKILQYYSLSRTLTEDQSLLKCVNCQNVAIVTDSISQCQSGTCNYITCLKCGSFSTSGHQNFLDKCRQMKLEVDTPENHATPEKRRNTIYTYSNTAQSSLHTPSSSSASSSGYFTDSNASNRSTSNYTSHSNTSTQRRMSEINQNSIELKQRAVLKPSSVPNIQSGVKPKLRLVPTGGAENKVPPSPPSPPSPSTRREKRGAAFKRSKNASKKSLRRLLL